MNRNVESHFAHVPHAEIPRSRFDCSQDIKFTFNVGDLVPWFVFEVLPGDTLDIETSKVVRLQTLLTPVMDNIYLDTYFFFVPNRLVWSHWKNFMGESDNAWLPDVTYTVPSLSTTDSQSEEGSGAVKVGDALDYMGVPVNVSNPYGSTTYFPINALPYRGYQLIWNEWFRDQNVQDAININFGDGATPIRNEPRGCLKACKYHDYFTSVLPSPQRGPAVAIGVQQVEGSSGLPVNAVENGVHLQTVPTTYNLSNSQNSFLMGTTVVNNTQGNQFNVYTRNSNDGSSGFSPNNLYAQLPTSGVSPLSINVNNLRLAVQTQKFYERLARGGSRYIEIIKSMFNVSSPDARMQRPEYLGGNRIPISIHQITNQSQGENDFLGDVGAMSLTTDRNSDFVKSFTEHGYVIGLCVARYDHSYPQGLNKMWTRRNREQFYWPVFAHLGEQAVYKSEIYFDGKGSDSGGTNYDVFGYQERWAEYRYQPNRVAGEMRPGVNGTLDSWHFADYYTQAPSYSDAWMKEDKSNVDRTLAVTSAVSNQLFCDIYVKNYASRPMPMYSVPGLVDHF